MCSAGREKGSPHSAQESLGRSDHRHSSGKLFVLGIGPGSLEDMSARAVRAIEASDIILGYKTYIALVADLIRGKEVISYPMKREMERANRAIDEALSGKWVSLLSSGDPGIFGMAGPVLEALSQRGINLDVEIVPGIPSFSACAAILGAPLMSDFAVISLSDLLVPWEKIARRLEAAASSDLVIVLYNAKSRGRSTQIEAAARILLRHRPASTWVGIVRNARRQGENVVITQLGSMLQQPIDMLTTIIIGNSTTFTHGQYMVTPRGYPAKSKGRTG